MQLFKIKEPSPPLYHIRHIIEVKKKKGSKLINSLECKSQCDPTQPLMANGVEVACLWDVLRV